MELDELESLSKNDFLPLIPLIKQEQIDPNPTDMNVDRNLMAGTIIDPATTTSTSSSSSSTSSSTSSSSSSSSSTSASSLSLISNPCDSMEKRTSESSTTTTSTNHHQKANLMKCVFCDHILGVSDRPKLLECLHIACAQCIQTRFSELERTMPTILHCPICNMVSQHDFIIDNQFLIEQCTAAGGNMLLSVGGSAVSGGGLLGNGVDGVGTESSAGSRNSGGGGGGSSVGGGATAGTKSAISNVIQCSSCSDNAIATSWCVDCSEYICDSCVQAHQRLKITKDHTIKPKEEANNEQLPGSAGIDKLHMCPLHPQEKFSLYCETCEKLTCRDCQLSDHRDHKYKFAHEIATETRQALSTLLSEINYKRFLLSTATQVIDDRQKMIGDKKSELIKEVTSMVVKITNTVNMRGKLLIMRLNEVCDSKLKVLIEKKEHLQLLADHTDHCIEFMSGALEKGSDYAILSSKKSLVNQLQKLKSQRADIPNPEIPVRIQVQLNQTSELQKVIAQVGTIVVDGKPYPPTPCLPNGPSQHQQPSPNMAPPLRPAMPPGLPGVISPPGTIITPNGYPGQQSGPSIYNNPSSQQQQQQQFNGIAINRPYTNEGSVRYGGIPTVGIQRQGQPHVSSSTHPQNMDISLRGLLNNQAAQNSTQPTGHLPFNGPPNYPGGQNAPSPHQQMCAQMNAQMRPHFISAGPPGQQHPNFPPGGPSGPNPNFSISNSVAAAAAAAARYPNYQRMSSHAQQQSAAMTSSGNNQIPSPGAIPRSQMALNNPMANSMGFHNGQAAYNHPQTSPHGSGGNSTKMQWHIPQSAQNTGCSLQGPQCLIQFPNNRQTENFKISLKSLNALKSNSSGHSSIMGSGGGHLSNHGSHHSSSSGSSIHHGHGLGGGSSSGGSHNHSQHHLSGSANYGGSGYGVAGGSGGGSVVGMNLSGSGGGSSSANMANNSSMNNSSGGNNSNSSNVLLNAGSLNLGPAVSVLPNVTSTNPKTPSPSTNEASKDFTEPIDKVRDDSINDLMATIAKLDSNGVQVLPEGRTKTTSPQVHSSTDLSNTQEVNHHNKTNDKDDPNEDWCAVCLDGGELMCCDKCPKVFHQNCHIPTISSLPDESESWQCLLCVNIKELTENNNYKHHHSNELSSIELQILQRICLELYCQYEQSLHFREPESPANTAYYEIICNPMSLDVIRTRLDPSSPNHYKDIASFISDVRLIFKNTYLFYQEDSKTYTNAKYLESFFEEQLMKWLPSYAKTNKNHHHHRSSNGNNNNSSHHSSGGGANASPASGGAGTPSPSLADGGSGGGGRKSANSLSGDNTGGNPAKRLRSTE